jgi:hypothetical protein
MRRCVKFPCASGFAGAELWYDRFGDCRNALRKAFSFFANARIGADACVCLKACRTGVDVWKLRSAVWDAFGACLKALVMQNGRFKMNAIVMV